MVKSQKKEQDLAAKGLTGPKRYPPSFMLRSVFPELYTFHRLQKMIRQNTPGCPRLTPFAEKYGLRLNSDYKVSDVSGVAKNILKQKGTVLVVWEHKGLVDIAERLGVEDKLHWSSDDFDTIWVITFSKKGKARLLPDQEGLHPSAKCGL
jgi:hypothetical protein